MLLRRKKKRNKIKTRSSSDVCIYTNNKCSIIESVPNSVKISCFFSRTISIQTHFTFISVFFSTFNIDYKHQKQFYVFLWLTILFQLWFNTYSHNLFDFIWMLNHFKIVIFCKFILKQKLKAFNVFFFALPHEFVYILITCLIHSCVMIISVCQYVIMTCAVCSAE